MTPDNPRGCEYVSVLVPTHDRKRLHAYAERLRRAWRRELASTPSRDRATPLPANVVRVTPRDHGTMGRERVP